MSVKKLLTLSVAGLAAIGATAALAGGPEYAPPAPSFAGVYIEGNVGYASRDWTRLVGAPFGTFVDPFGVAVTSTNNNSNNGGFAAIVDLGYQFNEFISLELGWIHLPSARINGLLFPVTNPDGTDFSFKFTSWAAYLAGKLTVPVYEDTYLFGKLGAAYVNNNGSLSFSPVDPFTGSFGSTNSHYWTPMFAFGAQYYFNPNLSINFQYTRLPGYHHFSSHRFVVPESDIFTLGLGYKFLT